jgi:AraC-like DNA-binding protein
MKSVHVSLHERRFPLFVRDLRGVEGRGLRTCFGVCPYLRDESLSISQIAWLLGYQEVSAFTHAFKRWTVFR